ncbi:MAG TPA: RluA family pseudouridine synthase [Candidatus Binatia bacterium]|nr:RluA family pseudouridine synthase [Candidatus Binatia bacterium]
MRRSPPDQETPRPVKSWTVPRGQEAPRLDFFVRRCLPHLSLREARRAIEERAFWINNRPARKGDRLLAGDVLTLRGPEHWLSPAPLPEENIEVPILYEDEFVLAVDKPAEMATHGFSGRQKNTLANVLLALRPSLRHVGKSSWEPGLVHRLDQGTSGIVLVAKNQITFEKLRFQFRRGLVKKKYWALAWGTPKREGAITYPLIHDPKNRSKMKALMVVKRGEFPEQTKIWKALTRFRVIGYAERFSLLEMALETGVTHQIRAHLQTLGHPLVGDRLYGKNRPDPFGLGHQFLHAFYLGFSHPESGEEVAIESPLPPELRRILGRLRINL